MTIAQARWARIKDILGNALELAPDVRRAYVAAQCQGDAELAAEVESLLAQQADTGAAAIVTRDAWQLLGDATPNVLQGQLLGPWRLGDEIGRGGMGVVYAAERADGAYQQRAAIKLLRGGATRDAARMRRERQMLAELNHPHIAHLIDGGALDDGAPYLVMEFVEGKPIDDYCREHRLDVAARVALAVAVCAAVQSAHQRLVIHRDIKPSNILVTVDGTPKLLDFGVSRLIEEGTDTQGDATQGTALLFTPRYASPEQVKGLPVDVATDVYGLGMLLYELLAGASPYARIASNQATNAAAAMQVVIEDEVRRASEVARLSQPAYVDDLRGDLDTILAKACAKDPRERYATAAQLAEDLERWLHGRPIQARPQSVPYLVRKFVTRHRLGTVLGGAAVLAIAAGVAGTLIQTSRAQQRYAQALEVASKVTSKYYDAIETLPGATAVRKEMTADGLKLLDGLAKGAEDDPAVAVELARGYRRLAEIQFNGRGLTHLGDNAGATRAREKSSAILQRVLARAPADYQANIEYAWLESDEAALLGQAGKTDEALKKIDASTARFNAALARDPDAAPARFQLAATYFSGAQAALNGNRSGRSYIDHGKREFARWGTVNQATPNYNNFRLLIIRTEYREAFREKKWDEAVALADQEIALIDGELVKAPDNALYWQNQMIAWINSGAIMNEQNRPADALARFSRAGERAQRILGHDANNLNVKGGWSRLATHTGRSRVKLGQQAEAVRDFETSVARWEALVGKDLPAYMVRQHGEAYWWLATTARAARLVDKSRRAALALVAHAARHPQLFADGAPVKWLADARAIVEGKKT